MLLQKKEMDLLKTVINCFVAENKTKSQLLMTTNIAVINKGIDPVIYDLYKNQSLDKDSEQAKFILERTIYANNYPGKDGLKMKLFSSLSEDEKNSIYQVFNRAVNSYKNLLLQQQKEIKSIPTNIDLTMQFTSLDNIVKNEIKTLNLINKKIKNLIIGEPLIQSATVKKKI